MHYQNTHKEYRLKYARAECIVHVAKSRCIWPIRKEGGGRGETTRKRLCEGGGGEGFLIELEQQGFANPPLVAARSRAAEPSTASPAMTATSASSTSRAPASISPLAGLFSDATWKHSAGRQGWGWAGRKLRADHHLITKTAEPRTQHPPPSLPCANRQQGPA